MLGYELQQIECVVYQFSAINKQLVYAVCIHTRVIVLMY
jgi:hypothetical protein